MAKVSTWSYLVEAFFVFSLVPIWFVGRIIPGVDEWLQTIISESTGKGGKSEK